MFPGTAGAIGRDIYAFEPSKLMDARFVFRALQYSISDVIARAHGDIPGLTKRHILDHQVTIPGRKAQQAVASKIDELFSSIDEGERALERVRKLVERYRQSVLKAAVTGELTREWREQHANELESGEALLTRILEARRQAWEQSELAKIKAKGTRQSAGKSNRYKAPKGADATQLPELPLAWAWATPAQLAAPMPNALVDGPFGSNLKTSHYTKAGPRVVRLQNIRDGYFADHSTHISVAHFRKLQRHETLGGDLLAAGLGEVLPRTCVCPNDLGPMIVKADCIRMRFHSDVSVKCMSAFMNAPPTRNRTKVIVHGVGRPRLNLAEQSAICVPLPPMKEQLVIAQILAQVEQASSLILGQVEAEILRSSATRQAILKRAFSGHLVPQEAIDEPASVLLERIAAERVAAPKRAAGKAPRARKTEVKAKA